MPLVHTLGSSDCACQAWGIDAVVQCANCLKLSFSGMRHDLVPPARLGADALQNSCSFLSTVTVIQTVLGF